MINWKVRIKNPVWWVQIVLAILGPILGYFGLTLQDLTSWGAVFNALGEAVRNPYVLGMVAVSVWNAINDPTTKGITDSTLAMSYTKPKEG